MPETGEGKRLLAHELTHTIQQDGAVEKSIEQPPNLSHSVNRTGAIRVQRSENSTSAIPSQTPPRLVPWTGGAVSMANAMRNLLITQEMDRIADSLSMLWELAQGRQARWA